MTKCLSIRHHSFLKTRRVSLIVGFSNGREGIDCQIHPWTFHHCLEKSLSERLEDAGAIPYYGGEINDPQLEHTQTKKPDDEIRLLCEKKWFFL